MSARDDYDLTIDIPAALPAPTRFERVTGERVDVNDGPLPSPTGEGEDHHGIAFTVGVLAGRRAHSHPRTTQETGPIPTDVATLALDVARFIALRLPHTRQAPYHIRNLPPGTTKRAFQDAVRRGDVAAARVGGRALVQVTDWQEYVDARRVRRARKTGGVHETAAREPSDDELLASVGARRTRR